VNTEFVTTIISEQEWDGWDESRANHSKNETEIVEEVNQREYIYIFFSRMDSVVSQGHGHETTSYD